MLSANTVLKQRGAHMNHIEATTKFVNESFRGKNIKHFERTLYWFEKFLNRSLSDAEIIAAYSHDIERAFRGTNKSTIQNVENYTDPEFLTYHQNQGAEIMTGFLRSNEFKDIGTVAHLISRHEQGGDMTQNALMDADSMSFFETNAEKFVTEKVKIEGLKPVRDKLDWMFNRMVSGSAKRLAEPLYKKWISILDEGIA